MDDQIVKSITQTASLLPRASLEQLRESIADKLAQKLVDRQLRELRENAIKAVRETLLATIDQVIAEALAAVEREDDAAWAQWKRVAGEAPLRN